MIKVDIEIKDDKVYQLMVQGHANFDKHGKDIVCSAVSAITFGGLNALAEYYGYPNDVYEVDVINDQVKLKVKDLNEDRIQVVLETVCIQLYSIYESYSKYVKIKVIGGT